MVATPARIALSLNDGVVLSKTDAALKADHPNAVSADTEIEMFFDTASDAQVLLDERWAWRSAPGRPKEQIELSADLGLGTTTPLTPALPTFTIADETRGIRGAVCAVRGFSIDHNTDRYAVEIVGLSSVNLWPAPPPNAPPFDASVVYGGQAVTFGALPLIYQP